ncbi:MAG: response regulator transcription factor [Thermoflexus sp.]
MSPRQRAVALGVAWGWSDKEIAEALGCRPTSVRTHLRAVLGRLGLPDRVAVRAWVRTGRLDDPWIAPLLDLEDPPFLGEGFLKK